MICNYFSQSTNVLGFLEIFLSISLLVSSIQHIKNIGYFSDGNLFPWSIYKYGYRLSLFKYSIFDHIMDRRGMLILNCVRMILLPFLFVGNGKLHLLVLFLLTISTILIYLRSSIMCNAADQVNNIILTGLVIHNLLLRLTSIPMIIYFYGALLIISYFSSGLLKVYQEKWRNGTYLRQVIITRNYGCTKLITGVKAINKGSFKFISQAVIFWQVTSFLIPLLPDILFYFYIFIALSFHLVTGFLLRLNSFIWTFTGLLPCLVYIHEKIITCL